jgi:hypothetical protein
VAEVVDEAWRLPVSVREGFIRQALRILTRRAALLVKYVDAQLYVFTPHMCACACVCVCVCMRVCMRGISLKAMA